LTLRRSSVLESPPWSSYPLELVAEVVDRVGDRVEVICDGGIRRGSDLVKAVALGARAGMAGRAWAYALAAGGEQGVVKMLAWLDEGVRRTLTLIGCERIDQVGRQHVRWREE
jgi:L-lactate dehydrogenase (cytochrome)